MSDDVYSLAKRVRPALVRPRDIPTYLEANAPLLHLIAEAYDAKDWSQYVYSHSPRWRFEALLGAVRRGLNGREYWELVTGVWQMSDTPGTEEVMWQVLYGKDMPPGRRAAMNDEELKVFDALPEVVTIYRGAIPAHRKGMSWTLDLKVAKFFATENNRRMADGLVYRAEVPRSAVLVYYVGREESEVLVLPQDLPEPEVYER